MGLLITPQPYKQEEIHMKFLTFKQLVRLLSEVKTSEDLWNFTHEVDMSFQHEKITWEDNEALYRIVNNIVKRELING